MQKRWSKAEIAHLERHAGDNLEELAQKLNTDTDTVRRKLEDLGLTRGTAAPKVDLALESYDEGLRLLHDKKWKEAAKTFEEVISQSDSRQLTDRARQSLEICRRHTAADDGGGDPYLRAVFEKNRGNVEAALELCSGQGKESGDERWAYLAASLKALSGETEEALGHLEIAIRLEPRNRVHAYHDPDFSELRGQEGFTALINAPSA